MRVIVARFLFKHGRKRIMDKVRLESRIDTVSGIASRSMSWRRGESRKSDEKSSKKHKDHSIDVEMLIIKDGVETIRKEDQGWCLERKGGRGRLTRKLICLGSKALFLDICQGLIFKYAFAEP